MECTKLCYLVTLLYFSLTTQLILGLKEPEKVKDSVSVSVDDGVKKCTMKLQSCSMKMGEIGRAGVTGRPGEKGEKGEIGETGTLGLRGDKGEKGEIGERGARGPQGEKGEKGETGKEGTPGLPGIKGSQGETGKEGVPGLPGMKGSQGETGKEGVPGLPGMKGSQGETGKEGVPGLPGMNGWQGETGRRGEPGEQGMKGDIGPPGLDGKKGSRGMDGRNGEAGLPGDVGPRGPSGPSGYPGVPGIAGVCGCSTEEPDDPPSEEGRDELASLSLLPRTCRYLPFSSEGKIEKIRSSDPFEVLCKKNRTCLKSKEITVDVKEVYSVKYGNETHPFWLSKRGFNIADFYGVAVDQLKYLQKMSSSVTQTIRYHCKNSYIYDDNSDPARYLRVSLWNDLVIGPHPTQNSPLFYTIEDHDGGCKKHGPGLEYSSETWKFSDITITSNIENRLPVIDFYIEDIRKGDQMFYLEPRELCFA